MEKTCTKCIKSQDIEQFPVHKNYKDGRTTWCRKCLSIQSKNWHKNNKGRSYEISRNSYRKNPDVKRNSKFKSRYGITLEQFEKMSKAQNDTCAICTKHKSECKNNKLFVDHCHETNEIRGLLCNECNAALGFFRDNEDLLLSAIDYLKRSGKRKSA